MMHIAGGILIAAFVLWLLFVLVRGGAGFGAVVLVILGFLLLKACV
jgi:hypothetical protein